MREEAPKLTAFYFGCVREISGHYLYTQHGDRPTRAELDSIPQRLRCPDGTFAPRMTKAPGQALLTHHEGWTILSFWDYSIDHRPGSNSTFLINALVDFKDAMEYAKAAFPSIWTRFTFEVVQEKR